MLTDVERVEILLDGSDSVRLEMILWDHSGVIHHCDGEEYLSPIELRGISCGCPQRIEDRKSEAKKGVGPQPSTQIRFRVARFPELGLFSYRSNSWSLFDAANTLRSLIVEGGRETLCELSIEVVELESAAGANLSYFCPAVDVLKS
ncbi:hypothetical protein [Streptomyces sp. NPDC050548]|uniref:recombination directionality factor n=1 Tax=Streptomyces sp. NPDC050548 TaxID=3365629 RepID=UPI0037A15B6F